MNETPTIDPQEIRSGLNKQSLELVNQWLSDGRGVAVFENRDMGHPELGYRKYLSRASFKGEVPNILPDFGDSINWRYVLVGVYEGPAI